jgi:high-affinity iron transporter
MLRRLLACFTLAFAALCAVSAASGAAAAAQPDVQTTWQLLDYVAVDYGGAVRAGKVISASEYAEMREFSGSAGEKIAALPSGPRETRLVAESDQFKALIEQKADPGKVAAAAHALEKDLLTAFPVPLGPRQPPDLARGAQLFEQNCAACHGLNGSAQTPMARKLDPPPIAFADRQRARQRSPFALYQVINQGLPGTAMQSFAQLPDADKWALAFRASRFAYPQPLVDQGKRIWDSDPALRSKVPDLNALASLTENQLAAEIGADKAGPVIAFLRTHPEAVSAKVSNLSLARERLSASLSAYRAGNQDEAKRLALSAYLDGIEPIEPILGARDAELMHRIESAMGELRSRIGEGASVADVNAQAQQLDGLFSQAEQALAPHQASALSTFLSALTILVREGVEALLIVIAMIAFLRKAERTESLRYVHAGWVAALLAGGLTWFAATTLISVSGASRELTEGFGGILAAGVLVFVGIWMHGKSRSNAWQHYVQTKMSDAVARESGWFLFGLAFVVVYREVFETILFFAAMWEESPTALLAGVGAGAVILGAIAWALLRYSRKLPIGQFFRYSSILMAVLAVVLAGKGVAAIQEAGLLPISPAPIVPRIELLGITPSLQVVVAQIVVIVALWIGFTAHRRKTASS